VRQHARKDFPAQRTHTIEIDLRFAPSTRIVECFHIGIWASDSEGYGRHGGLNPHGLIGRRSVALSEAQAIAAIAGRAKAEARRLPQVADPAILRKLNGVRSMATSLAIRLDRGVD
jgi:hypothetical protein